MNVVWFSWKDETHPQAGGAELVSSEIRKRLVRDGHNVKLIAPSYPQSKSKETLDGVEIYRTGGRFSIYPKAFLLFRKQFRNWPDLVIDEMNTIPFGCAFYAKKRTILLTYQLARKVWFYQMIFPLSLIGFLLEPLYLFLLSRKYKEVITESESTRTDLARFGFSKSNTSVIRVGMSLSPATKLETKKDMNTVLSLGAIRPMKRTLDIVKAFEYAKKQNSALRLKIAGDMSSAYAKKVSNYVKKSPYSSSIEILGKVSSETRMKLMQTASVIAVASVKEGWGLIITEASSQGTPAVAYDTDGLRDSVRNSETGLLVPEGDTAALGDALVNVLNDKRSYEKLRRNAWEWSHEFTFENSYLDFMSALKI